MLAKVKILGAVHILGMTKELHHRGCRHNIEPQFTILSPRLHRLINPDTMARQLDILAAQLALYAIYSKHYHSLPPFHSSLKSNDMVCSMPLLS